jgi:tRNA G18 (ribose-2'-O)-methylase SpoU
MYLVVSNISKRPNIRSLLLTAAAFGCTGVFIVGQRQFDMSPDGPDLPGQIKTCVQEGRMVIRRFEKWHECVLYLKENNVQLVGVEIHEDAQNINDFVAQEPTADVAFLMGNEGQGLNAKQMDSCDAFVIISQYGGGTASLNVNVAASIVLHRFHEYQRTRQRKNCVDCNSGYKTPRRTSRDSTHITSRDSTHNASYADKLF